MLCISAVYTPHTDKKYPIRAVRRFWLTDDFAY